MIDLGIHHVVNIEAGSVRSHNGVLWRDIYITQHDGTTFVVTMFPYDAVEDYLDIGRRGDA